MPSTSKTYIIDVKGTSARVSGPITLRYTYTIIPPAFGVRHPICTTVNVAPELHALPNVYNAALSLSPTVGRWTE